VPTSGRTTRRRNRAARTPCYGNFDRRLAFLPERHAEAERRYGRGLIVGQ
jgi:hypothetical protein